MRAPKYGTSNDSAAWYADFKKKVEVCGWEVVSSEEDYKNQHTKTVLKCPRGHFVEMFPEKFVTRVFKAKAGRQVSRRGSGCPKCSGFHKTIYDLRAFAQDRGWKCLSTHYTTQRELYLWECPVGHTIERSFHYFQKVKSCPKCGFVKIPLSEYQKIAQQNLGECLTDAKPVYSERSRLQFLCSKGHVFRATFRMAKSEWCPYC